MRYDIDGIMFSLADSIDDTMKRKKVTTRELANRLGVKYQRVYRHKAGYVIPTLESLLKMCNALDVDLNELIGAKHERR